MCLLLTFFQGSNSASLDSLSTDKLSTTCSKESLIEKPTDSQKSDDKSANHLVAQPQVTVVRKNSVNMGTQYEPPLPPPPPTPPPLEQLKTTIEKLSADKISKSQEKDPSSASATHQSWTADGAASSNQPDGMNLRKSQAVVFAPIPVKANCLASQIQKTEHVEAHNPEKSVNTLKHGQEHFTFKPIEPATMWSGEDNSESGNEAEQQKQFNEIREDIRKLLGAKKQQIPGTQRDMNPQKQSNQLHVDKTSDSVTEMSQLSIANTSTAVAFLPSTPTNLPNPPEKSPPLPPTPPPLPPLLAYRADTVRF